MAKRPTFFMLPTLFKKEWGIVPYLLIILLLSAVVTLLNLGWHKAFIGGDYGIKFHFPGRLISFSYYIWNGFSAPGRQTVTNTMSFLWVNSYFILFKLGLDPVAIERLVYFLFFAVSGLGVFFLLNILIKKYCNNLTKKAIYLGAFTGSLLYMFNHFTMYIVSVFPPIGPYHLSYMLLPLAMALFIYNLQIKTSFSSILSFTLIFLFLLNGHPSNTLSIVFFLTVYYLIIVRQTKKDSAKPKLFLIASLILTLLLSSYIYLSILGIRSNPYGKIPSLADSLGSLRFNSRLTSFLNLFRLAGVNTWPNYPYYHSYMNNPFSILFGYFIPIFVFASLFFRKGKKIKIFFGLVIIIALFFAKGSNPPFEKLFLFFYIHIPFFGMYRAVYHKFVFFIGLSYSVLIGFFVSQSFTLLKNYYRKFKYIVVLLPFIICLYAWPFFTNNIVLHCYLSNIPEEYTQIAEDIKNDPSDFKILSAPPSCKWGSVILKWGDDNYFSGNRPDRFLLNKSVLDSYWFISNIKRFTDENSQSNMKFEKNFDSVLNYAGILNTKYVFLHKDFVDKYYLGPVGNHVTVNGKLSAKIIQLKLEKQDGVELIKDSEYYALYKISDEYFLPHIYACP